MTDETTPKTEEQSAEAPKQAFAVQRIYIKDVSFEAPSGIIPNAENWKPQVSQDLNTQVNRVNEELFEVVLNLTVTVKTDDDKTAFLVEVQQAGLFAITGIEGPQLQHLLSAQSPQMLFPYAREAIDSLVVRGGFPPLMLPPINFDALFAHAMAEAQKKAQAQGEASAEPAAH